MLEGVGFGRDGRVEGYGWRNNPGRWRTGSSSRTTGIPRRLAGETDRSWLDVP
jgi:hypothetical protein